MGEKNPGNSIVAPATRLISMYESYNYDALLQREWIEAKGEEEVAMKELAAVKDKLAQNEAKMKADSPHVEELKQKYKEQEELLGKCYG